MIYGIALPLGIMTHIIANHVIFSSLFYLFCVLHAHICSQYGHPYSMIVPTIRELLPIPIFGNLF